MYGSILPSLRRLDPALGVPDVYYASDEGCTIVMENLKKSGFHIPDMVQGGTQRESSCKHGVTSILYGGLV